MACCCRPSVPLDEVLLVLLPWCCSSSEGVLSSLRLLDLGSLLLLLLRLGLPLDGHEALWDSICVVVLVVDPPVHGLSHVSWCVWHHLHTRPPQSLQTECTVRERHLLQSKCIEGGVGLAAPLLRWPPLPSELVAWAVGTCWKVSTSGLLRSGSAAGLHDLHLDVEAAHAEQKYRLHPVHRRMRALRHTVHTSRDGRRTCSSSHVLYVLMVSGKAGLWGSREIAGGAGTSQLLDAAPSWCWVWPCVRPMTCGMANSI